MKKIKAEHPLALTLFALAAAPSSPRHWPGLHDPMRFLVLNLDMSPADWTTVKGDTTYESDINE